MGGERFLTWHGGCGCEKLLMLLLHHGLHGGRDGVGGKGYGA